MESLVVKPDKVKIDYDEKGDVLYISLDTPKEADDSIEPQEGVIMRTREGELVGLRLWA